MDVDALAQARDAFPWWAVWGQFLVQPLVCLLTVYLAASAGSWIASPRIPQEAHWTERARLAYPARIHAAFIILLLPALLGIAAAVFAGPLVPASPRWLGIACGLAAFVAGLHVHFRAERLRRPQVVGMASFARGGLAMMLVMFPHLWVALALLLLLPTELSALALGMVLLGAVLFLFSALGGGILIARALGLLRPAPPRVLRIVEQTAAEVGVQPRAVYEACTTTANAFALPLPRLIVVTERLPQILADEGLAAVMGHELGHLGEPRGVALARLAPLGAIFALAAVKPLSTTAGPFVYMVALLALLIAMVVVRRMARRLEQRADHVAHAHEKQTGAYARALESIYRDNLVPAVMPTSRTVHPHLVDRLVQAGVTPEYPRPAPPSRWRARIAFGMSAIVTGAIWAGFQAVGAWQASEETEGRRGLLRMAVWGGDARDLAGMAANRVRGGDPLAAITLYEAASDAEPTSSRYPALRAALLGELDRCEDALSAAEQAQHRLSAHPDREEIETVRGAWHAVWLCRQRAGLGELPLPE